MTDVALRIRNLTKDFDIYERPTDLAIEMLTRRKRHTTFRALDNISFEVPKGEVLGIIGSNGAGKSTLLKIITGVLDATSGSVEISGRVTAILELGLGFNPEYSGRENIFLSGLLYGMDRSEIERKIDSIIEFSGLEEFIERPVKTYSSGMHARLAFSIATAAEPEILIIDEALAAGDSAFLQKCTRRIHELCNGGRTVLMVSHGTGLLAQLCTRVMWVEHGKIKMLDSPIAVVQSYDLAAHHGADAKTWIEHVDDSLVSTNDPSVTAFESDASYSKTNQVFRRGPILIDRVALLNAKGEPTARLGLMDPFTIQIHYHCEGELPRESLGAAVAVNQQTDLAPIMAWFSQNRLPDETPDTYFAAPFRKPAYPKGVMELHFPYAPFRAGDYYLSVGLLPNQPGTWSFYEYRHFFYRFSIEAPGFDLGAPIFLPPRVSTYPAKPQEPEINKKELPAPRDGEPRTLGEEVAQICFGDGCYPDGWPLHLTCPTCGSAELKDAFTKGGFQHRTCLQCGLIFVDPYPPERVRDRLYSGQYYTRVREFYEAPRARAGKNSTDFSAPRDILEEIIERATSDNKEGVWLEVGGGLGSFAALIKDSRPRWSVSLNDDNPRSAELAREIFGLETITTKPEEMHAQGIRFDVISSVAVLEHIPKPEDFLKAYARLLKPGGLLVSVVPHFTPLNAAVSKGSSPNVTPPFHTSLFSERSVQALLERLGCFTDIIVEQHGAAAFSLIEHVDVADRWDITIPTKDEPSPKSFILEPYLEQESLMLNALHRANQELGDFFLKADGRQYLVAYARLKPGMHV